MGIDYSVLVSDSCAALETQVAKRKYSTNQCCSLSRGVCIENSCTERCRESTGRAREANDEDPKLFLGPEGHDGDNDSQVAWRRLLQVGASMSLHGEPVIIALDEQDRLDIRQHQSVYPLLDLHGCEQLDPSTAKDGFELMVTFSNWEPLVFQFDDEENMASFAATLQALAREARAAAFHSSVSSSGFCEANEERLPVREAHLELGDPMDSPKESLSTAMCAKPYSKQSKRPSFKGLRSYEYPVMLIHQEQDQWTPVKNSVLADQQM